MIEIAPKSNHLLYEDALLYCAFCNHAGYKDWRMPTKEEWRIYCDSIGWHLNDPSSREFRYPIIPVRDIIVD
jgi:hypothetical protein